VVKGKYNLGSTIRGGELRLPDALREGAVEINGRPKPYGRKSSCDVGFYT